MTTTQDTEDALLVALSRCNAAAQRERAARIAATHKLFLLARSPLATFADIMAAQARQQHHEQAEQSFRKTALYFARKLRHVQRARHAHNTPTQKP